MKIPPDLEPGDRLWYSKTEYAAVANATVRLDDVQSPYDHTGDIWASSHTGKLCYRESGEEVDQATPPIIRIERIASAPAKVKRANVDTQAQKDAAYLLRVFDWKNAVCDSERRMVVRLAPAQIWRIRAIARRLKRSKP